MEPVMKLNQFVFVIIFSVLLTACGQAPSTGNSKTPAPAASEYGVQMIDGVKKKSIEGFGGVIAESYDESEEWWAPYEVPNEDAPNVIIFLLDDT